MVRHAGLSGVLRLSQARSMQSMLDLFVGRLAKQAEHCHGRQGAAAAADAAGKSKGEAERLTATATRAENAAVNIVVRKGVDVVSVTHLGRHLPAEVLSALLFKPRRCSHPGCTKSGYLERDHIVEMSRGGRTQLDNLQWLCAEHHRGKTRAYTGGRTYRPKKPRAPSNAATDVRSRE